MAVAHLRVTLPLARTAAVLGVFVFGAFGILTLSCPVLSSLVGLGRWFLDVLARSMLRNESPVEGGVDGDGGGGGGGGGGRKIRGEMRDEKMRDERRAQREVNCGNCDAKQ